MWPSISVRSAWLGAISPVFSCSWAESFSQRAAAAPARLSGLTSAMRLPSLPTVLPISPARLARSASFSSLGGGNVDYGRRTLRFRHSLPVFAQALDVVADRLSDRLYGSFFGVCSGDATGKVGNVGRIWASPGVVV